MESKQHGNIRTCTCSRVSPLHNRTIQYFNVVIFMFCFHIGFGFSIKRLEAAFNTGLDSLPRQVKLEYMCLRSPIDACCTKDNESVGLIQQAKMKQINKGLNRNSPVIFLHGLLGQKQNFATIGSILSNQLKCKRDIYAVDLRNHGNNNPKEYWREGMSYAEMTVDVISFMDTNELQDAILIGHSMGGKLAASIALSYPPRVSGVIVMDIAPVKYTVQNDDCWKEVQDIVDILQKVNLDGNRVMTKRKLELELAEYVDDDSLRQYILGAVESIRAPPSQEKKKYNDSKSIPKGVQSVQSSESSLRWKINVQAIADQMEVLAGFDVEGYNVNCDYDGQKSNLFVDQDLDQRVLTRNVMNQSPRYYGDTMFMNSRSSNYIRSSHLPIIKDYFPNFMLATVRGVGHTMHHENPEETVKLMKKFLDR